MQAYYCLRKNNVLTMITSMAGRREVSRWSCTWRCYFAHLLFVNHKSNWPMAQGKTKGLQTKAPSARHSRKAAANTKKGKKYIPPKKPALIKHVQMHRVSLWLPLYLREADLVDIVLECENWQFHWTANGLRRLSGQTDNHEKHCRSVSFIAKQWLSSDWFWCLQ